MVIGRDVDSTTQEEWVFFLDESAKTVPWPYLFRWNDGIVWHWHLLVNLGIYRSPSYLRKLSLSALWRWRGMAVSALCNIVLWFLVSRGCLEHFLELSVSTPRMEWHKSFTFFLQHIHIFQVFESHCVHCLALKCIFFMWTFIARVITHQTFVLMKTSWKRLEDVFRLRLQKMFSRRLNKTNIFALVIHLQKTPSRRLQDVLVKTNIFVPDIRLQHVFKTSCKNVKTYLRHLQDVLKMWCITDIFWWYHWYHWCILKVNNG